MPDNFFTDLWKVKLGDFGRGLVIAIITVPLTIVYESVTASTPQIVVRWESILGAALAGGLGYILKNLSTGSNGKLLTNK